VTRDDDAQATIVLAVPIHVGGDYTEVGPGGRTWGCRKTASGIWQIAPSINVNIAREAFPQPVQQSIWHHTPEIVAVPDAGEPWQ
jgi:hypothetical protein